MIYVLLTGFLFGMAHALEADHLAAVASFSVRSKSRLAILRQGVSWGVGHTITLFLVVVPVFLLGGHISPRIESGMEGIVGLVLIVLGGGLVWRLRRERVHVHVHSHDEGPRHLHVHSHKNDPMPHSRSPHEHEHTRGLSARSLGVGLVHGLAGSAALLIVVATELSSAWLVVPFVLLFGVGSIAGMALVSQIISVPLQMASRVGGWLFAGVQYAAAIAAIAIGATFAYGGLGAFV